MKRTKPIYYNYSDSYAWYDGRYKLVSFRSGPWELYDLTNDPTEKNDLASVKTERVSSMSDAWYEYAEKVDMAKEQYRTQEKKKSVPWGIMSQTTKKGKTKKDELTPRWGTKLPHFPYKTKGLSPSTYSPVKQMPLSQTLDNSSPYLTPQKNKPNEKQ